MPDKLGFTALGLACENGHAEVARMLIAANADPSGARENGWTNMMTAAYNGCTEVVTALVEGGADPRQKKESTGFTPIVAAAYKLATEQHSWARRAEEFVALVREHAPRHRMRGAAAGAR